MNNESHYYNPEADRLIETIQTATDRDLRNRQIIELLDLLNRDLPATGLYQQGAVMLISPRLKGWQPDLTHAYNFKFYSYQD